MCEDFRVRLSRQEASSLSSGQMLGNRLCFNLAEIIQRVDKVVMSDAAKEQSYDLIAKAYRDTHRLLTEGGVLNARGDQEVLGIRAVGFPSSAEDLVRRLKNVGIIYLFDKELVDNGIKIRGYQLGETLNRGNFIIGPEAYRKVRFEYSERGAIIAINLKDATKPNNVASNFVRGPLTNKIRYTRNKIGPLGFPIGTLVNHVFSELVTSSQLASCNLADHLV